MHKFDVRPRGNRAQFAIVPKTVGALLTEPFTRLALLALLALIALIGAVAQSAYAQGQLVFDNRVINIVVAPIYGLEPGNPTLSKRGNTPAGTPSGTQTYSAAPLEGNS